MSERDAPKCPLGEDCDLTVAWMAGAEDQRRHMHDRIAELAAEVARLTADRDRLAQEANRLRGAGQLIVDLLDDGFRCRSCGYMFVGHDGHDDCPMGHPNWDRLTIEQIADAARAALQGEAQAQEDKA